MRVNLNQLAFEVVFVFLVFGAALFLPAQSIRWLNGWIFLGLFFSFSLFLFGWLYKHNPSLLRERMRMATSDQQGWDKLLFPFLNLILLVWLVFDSFDANRLHWSSVPAWLQAVGAGILLSSFCLLFLTFKANSYLSPVVRFQQDRGHHAVVDGPYHYVRHPMYTGILLLVIGTSLLLGSAYGVLWAAAIMILLLRRAAMEERLLARELSDYAAYEQHVKYRLLPYIW